MLTVIVFVHEMGHYLVARWNGVAIQTFSLGFGPEVIGFDDRHGTRWRISLIPLGGYVRFVGDMNAASLPDPDAVAALPAEQRARLFINKNVWQRIAVVAAGPLANVLFTFAVLYGLLMAYGQYTIPPILGDIRWGGVAMEAGLLPGDRIVSVDGFAVRGLEDFARLVSSAPGREATVVLEREGRQHTLRLVPNSITDKDQFGNSFHVGDIGLASPATIVGGVTWGGPAMWSGVFEANDIILSVNGRVPDGMEDFKSVIDASPGKPVSIRIRRGGQEKLLQVVPAVVSSKDRSGKATETGRLGIALTYPPPSVSLYRPGPVEAISLTGEQIHFIVDRTVAFLGDFFVGRGDVEQLGGPVKVAKVSGEFATLGIVALINLAALLSLNIGIFNLLPVPILDGGHLLYYVLEAIRGRPLSQKTQEFGFRIGFAIVGALMVFTLLNDTLFEVLRHTS